MEEDDVSATASGIGTESLVSLLESTPLTYLIPKDQIQLSNLNNLNIHPQNVILKSNPADGNVEVDLMEDLKLVFSDPQLNEHNHTNFIKFNKLFQPSSQLSDSNQFSDLEQFILDNVKTVDQNDYKLENFTNSQFKRKLSSPPPLPLSSLDDEKSAFKKPKTTFTYNTTLESSQLNDLNLNGLLILLQKLEMKHAMQHEQEENVCWTRFSLIFDFSNSPSFIRSNYLVQLHNYLKSIDSLELILVEKIKDLITSPLHYILTLEWESFIDSKNPLEFTQMIEMWEILINSSFILIDLLKNSHFIENQLTFIFNSITLLGNLFLNFFTFKYPNEINLNPIIQLFNTFIDKLIDVLRDFPIDENFLGELEFSFMNLIFISNDNIQISNSLESLRLKASKIISAIFIYYPSQQELIINELIDNFNNLPTLKSKTKQYRFTYGNESVQVISILLMDIIQSDTHQFEFNERYFNLISMEAKSKSDLNLISNFESNLNTSIADFQSIIDKRCKLITNLIFKKIVNEFNIKKSLDFIFNDFLIILNYPEFPCCENLVSSILNMALHLIMLDSIPLNIQSYILELIGKIISKLLLFKSDEFNEIPLELSKANFNSFNQLYLNILSHFQVNNDRKSFDLLIIKYINFLNDFKCNDEEFVKVINTEIKTLYKYKFNLIKLPNINVSQSDLILNYQSILLSQSVSKNYKNLLNFTLNMLNNPKIKIRSSAIKSLSVLIDNDPNLLINLKNLIEVKLNENYSNVSDSILNLLSKYLVFNPKEIEKYYSSIINKSFDQNLSIKKKSIKLLIEIHHNSSNADIMDRIFENLILKLNDQDNAIVNMVIENLLNLIFIKIGKKYQNENLNNLKVKLSLNSDIDKIISNLIYLFKSMNWSLFEHFVLYNVKRVNKFNKANISTTKFSLNLYINRIVERIIELNDSAKKEMECLMGILATLVQIDNKLIIQDQLISIKPYIISNYENKVSYHTLKIFNLSLNNKNLNEEFIESLRKLLIINLTKFYSLELNEAIQCIWKLSKNNEKNLIILGNLSIKIIKLLLSFKDDMKSNDLKLRRILFILGSIGKFCNFETIRNVFIQANIGLRNESIMLYLLNKLIYFYDSPDSSNDIKIDCIKNILNICISHPKTFKHPKILKILNNGFTGKDMNVKVILINSVTKFMENIEKISNIDLNEMKRSDEIKFEIEVYHGDSKNDEINSICSNIVSKYFNIILKYCLSLDSELSFISVKFLQLSVNFGFAIPMVCFPTISALEIAKSDYIKRVAMGMHKKMYNSFATLIESCYMNGFKMTIDYSRSVYPGLNIIKCSSYLKYFIKLIDSPTKVTKFYSLLFKFINQNVNLTEFNKLSNDDILKMVNLSSFMVINLQAIEFLKLNEILNIIIFIEKLILSHSSNVIQHYQLVFYENDKSDADEWVKYLVMSKCLIMYHRLKNNLMNAYGISSNTLLKHQNGEEVSQHVNKIDSDLRIELEDMDLINFKTDKKAVKEMCELLITTIDK